MRHPGWIAPPRGACRGLALLLGGMLPALAGAQPSGNVARAPDSATVAAGAHYRASGVHRWLFGGVYRDLWTTPIRVAVLNLSSFDGGLVPEKTGGGKQTLSLHFTAADGSEYVFRSVDKDDAAMPPGLRDIGFARAIARDQTSSSHPSANLVAAPFLDAVGVLHDKPLLVQLPDDPLLGEFQTQFAGRLGVLTRFPGKGGAVAAEYGGALEIIDSDTLLQRLNSGPAERVDPTQFLTARLVDMLVNNYDRHPGNWKWARLEVGGAWQPISRDMDKVLISRDGLLPNLLQRATPTLISFEAHYPSIAGLTFNSFELDRRVLGGMSRATFDSVAATVHDRVTDAVITAAMAMMPLEYGTSQPAIVAKLRTRRDELPMIAGRFYRHLAATVDIHATDAAERATITRVDDHLVDVRIVGPDGAPHFARRFDARETSAIRLYLHGGDDQATIVGDVPSSIPVRIIGGNGTNELHDSSRVDGRGDSADLYDVGVVDQVRYGTDTLFHRRPLVRVAGQLVMAGRDHGTGTTPSASLKIDRDMGVMPQVGLEWRRYGFRDVPFATMVALEGGYSVKNDGFTVSLSADHRQEGTRVHFTALARMSELELLNYHGLGNSSPSGGGLPVGGLAPSTDFNAVDQTQWLLHPAIAFALGPRADLRLGPVLQYTVTSGPPGGILALSQPYGTGRFGEAGVRLSLSQDGRDRPRHRGTLLELRGDYFPSLWDVRSAFGSLTGTAGVFATIPVPLRPYFGLRGSARRVFGDFPFHEAAFLGGRAGIRNLDPQRYAGDASVTALAQLRIPVATFAPVLPLNVGVLVDQEIGRVYLQGESPGGWHTLFSTGFYMEFHDFSVDIRVIGSSNAGQVAVPALRLGRSVDIP